MSVEAFLTDKFEHTHERALFDNIVKELKSRYSEEDEKYIIVGNYDVNGYHIDAILLKRDCFVVIEFKSYTGTLECSNVLNGEWFMKTDKGQIRIIAPSPFVNPYKQVEKYRNKFIDQLTEFITAIDKSKPKLSLSKRIKNVRHAQSCVLFDGEVNYDNIDIPKEHPYFKITDYSNFFGALEQWTSKQIDLDDDHLDAIVQKMGSKKYELTPKAVLPDPAKSPPKIISKDNPEYVFIEKVEEVLGTDIKKKYKKYNMFKITTDVGYFVASTYAPHQWNLDHEEKSSSYYVNWAQMEGRKLKVYTNRDRFFEDIFWINTVGKPQ